MIVKSTFRRIGGLEAHLMRNDSNERVDVRMDLFRGATNLNLALRLMDGISRTNSRTVRSFIHVVIAPSQNLDDFKLLASLEMIENEFGIGSDAPRAVVQHLKGNRPSHFHAVYSIVDLHSGKAISSHTNYERDELVSRRLELLFDEKIVPGPRLSKNVAALRERGANIEADILSSHEDRGDSDSVSRQDRRQAERLGVDSATFSANVYRLFEEAAREYGKFSDLLAANGYALCKGDKAILVMEDATGFQMSLVRCLRREGKASGHPANLRERDLAVAYSDLKPKNEERNSGLSRARSNAARCVETEWSLGIYEALVDADQRALEAFRKKRKLLMENEENARLKGLHTTLRHCRENIVALHRQEDEVRLLRIARAFKCAQVYDTPMLRGLALIHSHTGVLMTAAGLTAAMAVSSWPASALPPRYRVRRTATLADRTQRKERSRKNGLSEVDFESRPEAAPTSRSQTRFFLNLVAEADRVLAGAYARSMLVPGGVFGEGRAFVNDVAVALGPDLVEGIAKLMDHGTSLQVRRLTDWCLGEEGENAAAVELSCRQLLDRPPEKTDSKQKDEQTPKLQQKKGGKEAAKRRGTAQEVPALKKRTRSDDLER